MIADIQTALKRLLYAEAALPQDALDIRFASPTPAWVSGLTRPTLNFFLHDLHENAALRSMEFHRTYTEQGTRQDLAPRRMDLKYLVTVFFKSQVDELGRDEWNVLWRVLAALMRQEEWDAQYVPGAVQALDMNVLGLVSNAANQTNYSVFTSLGLSVRPHLNYTLTVPLDLSLATFSPLVLERRVGLRPGLSGDFDDAELLVRASFLIRDPQGRPVPDALVRAQSGERGFTDAEGIVHLPLPREEVTALNVLTLDGLVFSADPAAAALDPDAGSMPGRSLLR